LLPKTLKLGCGPGFIKIVSAIRTFVLKAIRPRGVAQHNFFKLALGGPCKHFGGGRVGLIRNWLQLWPRVTIQRCSQFVVTTRDW